MNRYRMRVVNIPEGHHDEVREILLTLGGFDVDGIYELHAENALDFAGKIEELRDEIESSGILDVEFELVDEAESKKPPWLRFVPDEILSLAQSAAKVEQDPRFPLAILKYDGRDGPEWSYAIEHDAGRERILQSPYSGEWIYRDCYYWDLQEAYDAVLRHLGVAEEKEKEEESAYAQQMISNAEYEKVVLSELPGHIPGYRHPMGFIDHLPAYAQRMVADAIEAEYLRMDPNYRVVAASGGGNYYIISPSGDAVICRTTTAGCFEVEVEGDVDTYDTLQEAYDAVVEHLSRGSADAKLAEAAKKLERSAEKVEQLRRLLKKAQENPVRVDRD